MADGVNSIILLGNLGSDAELRSFDKRDKLAWRMATTRSWYDKAKDKRVDDTQWHNCVQWGDDLAKLAKYLTKGKRVFVQGRVENREYEDKHGDKKYITEVIVESMRLLDGGDGAGDRREARGRDDDRGRGREGDRPRAGGGDRERDSGKGNGRREAEEERIRPKKADDSDIPF